MPGQSRNWTAKCTCQGAHVGTALAAIVLTGLIGASWAALQASQWFGRDGAGRGEARKKL